jgi:hypothetical protein
MLQGNFGVTTTTTTFALGVAITTMAKTTQKKPHKFFKKQLLDAFSFLGSFCGVAHYMNFFI